MTTEIEAPRYALIDELPRHPSEASDLLDAHARSLPVHGIACLPGVAKSEAADARRWSNVSVGMSCAARTGAAEDVAARAAHDVAADLGGILIASDRGSPVANQSAVAANATLSIGEGRRGWNAPAERGP